MVRRRIRIEALLLFLLLMTAGCQSGTQPEQGYETTQATQGVKAETEEPYSENIFAMDTYMTLTAYGEHARKAVEEGVAEIERLDALLSTGKEDSEIAKLNESGSKVVSSDTQYLFSRSVELYKETAGCFNIAIYPVMEAWGFPSGNYRVPKQGELATLLALADPEAIAYDAAAEKLSYAKEQMAIDLGGIAKGYTSSHVMDIFRECGVTSGLVSLGGNVQVCGSKPNGSRWKVAIQSPQEDGSYLGVLEVADMAVITSGGYERYFEKDGVTYHHIIDPATGYPADNGLVSVTIISDDGTLADGLSTSLYIMGRDKAADYWQQHSGEFDMVLLDADELLYVTEGIADAFTSDYEITVIKKER